VAFGLVVFGSFGASASGLPSDSNSDVCSGATGSVGSTTSTVVSCTSGSVGF